MYIVCFVVSVRTSSVSQLDLGHGLTDLGSECYEPVNFLFILSTRVIHRTALMLRPKLFIIWFSGQPTNFLN